MLMLHDRTLDGQSDTGRYEGGKCNKHHLFYPRKQYNAGFAKRLREFPWLRIEIPIKKHRAIHQKVERVPLPPNKRLKEAFFILEDLARQCRLDKDADMEERINVLLCILDRHPECTPTCNALRKQKKVFLED